MSRTQTETVIDTVETAPARRGARSDMREVDHRPSHAYGIGLSNGSFDEHRRLRAAEALFDPATTRHLDAIGIGPGMHCLELGGGCGSIARFMSDRIGPTGSVLVTDLDISRLEGCDRPNIHAIVHDITADPLAAGHFDIIHARLLLEHLPSRLGVLDTLVSALRPGGWLLIEDADFSTWTHLPACRKLYVPADLGPRFDRLNAAVDALVRPTGVDLEFGRDLPAHLVDLGLQGVDAEACSRLVPGGSIRAEFFAQSARQLMDTMVATGAISRAEMEEIVDAFTSPGSMIQSFPLVSAWGRRT